MNSLCWGWKSLWSKCFWAAILSFGSVPIWGSCGRRIGSGHLFPKFVKSQLINISSYDELETCVSKPNSERNVRVLINSLFDLNTRSKSRDWNLEMAEINLMVQWSSPSRLFSCQTTKTYTTATKIKWCFFLQQWCRSKQSVGWTPKSARFVSKQDLTSYWTICLFCVLWIDKLSFNLLLVKHLAAKRLLSNVWLAFTEIFAVLFAIARYWRRNIFAVPWLFPLVLTC